MRRTIRAAAVAALAMGGMAAGVAHAEVAESGPQGFRLKTVEEIAAPPDKVFAALGQWGRWWDDAHTYSGKAANLTLDLKLGGCLCEALPDGGGVRHGVVQMVIPGKALRLDTALGPLQDEAGTGSLTFALVAKDGGTALTVTYNVGGLRAQMAAAAGGVDGVLTQQLVRLKRYVETDAP